MTREQVQQAIRMDFRVAPDRIAVSVHPTERTQLLSLAVRDLVAETGVAQIAYILGFKSKRLIQVNILWSTEISGIGAETIVALANALRDHFAAMEAIKPEPRIVNAQLKDGRLIVFRGEDAQGRTVELILAAAAKREGEGDAEAATTAQAMLRLNYIADPKTPDIMRISPGQF